MVETVVFTRSLAHPMQSHGKGNGMLRRYAVTRAWETAHSSA